MYLLVVLYMVAEEQVLLCGDADVGGADNSEQHQLDHGDQDLVHGA